ncbi:2-hydroxy-3-oxopropionate reductase [Maioricimonas rarisocia]|uniref:2-hydroxy-3-oxopropionate reductase n=1 Tax=Maioricimonas rarisocia TaxID=2528026 RepID=A0A517ZFR2_9PLAN|nr:NAD(P)-dependent oxidoreductase [Maioricimonas rarisocia]QDU41315.1 2-hydroxy-3-oxopropionate reductase [Maioricimonas rarisocia]
MPPEPSETIGLIGLGLLGSALAARLQQAGFGVHGYDVDEATRAAASVQGVSVAGRLEELSRRGTIVLCLPSSREVGEVVDALRPALSPATRVIDTTTGDPTETALIGEELSGYGIDYVDATVAGSSAQVREGRGVILAGGPAEAIADCDELLRALTPTVLHVGPCGSGAKMKLVVNLVLGLNRAVLAEGLAFAERLGLDAATALHALKVTPAYSAAMDTKGEKMVQREFDPQARLRQHLKDVRLMLAAARRTNAHVPLTLQHEALLSKLVEAGYGEEDNSAILRAFTDGEVS